ncbi:MAG: phage tail sheath C-terminal domain-containing protein [Pseudomonadota bacterium]|nr:phage tail sheath C-terminal domain-containing protein [Pseudomonadota bacterium]
MPTYQSPGVFIEEIAAGARPIQASGTSSTGFVGVLQIPIEYARFTPKASVGAMLVPVLGGDARPLESWSYARAFFQLGWNKKGGSDQLDAADDKMLDRFIPRLLQKFTVDPDRTSGEQIAFEERVSAKLHGALKAKREALDVVEAAFAKARAAVAVKEVAERGAKATAEAEKAAEEPAKAARAAEKALKEADAKLKAAPSDAALKTAADTKKTEAETAAATAATAKAKVATAAADAATAAATAARTTATTATAAAKAAPTDTALAAKATAAEAKATAAEAEALAWKTKGETEAALALPGAEHETLAAQLRVLQAAPGARAVAVQQELAAAEAAKAQAPAPEATVLTELDNRVKILKAFKDNVAKTADEVAAAATATPALPAAEKDALEALAEALKATGEPRNLRLDADKRLFNAVDVPTKPADKTTRAHWGVSLAVASNPTTLIEALTPPAVRAKIAFDADLPLADLPLEQSAYSVKLEAVQTGMTGPATMVTGIDAFHAWRKEFGRKLFLQLALCPAADVKAFAASAEHAAYAWEEISDAGKNAWHDWIRAQTGLRLLEISITGYFANGGAAAYVGVAIDGATQSRAPQSFLEGFFDTVGDVAILVAPGLNSGWQSAILAYAGAGRGDIFAVLDTPRYLLTDPPIGTNVNKADRTLEQDYCHYQLPELEFLKRPVVPALRSSPNDTAMDNCVPRDSTGHGAAYAPWVIATNPIANGLEDAYIVAPPSGFIAGAYGFNDATAGVQKVPANQVLKGITDLVCAVTAMEQNPLNVKGINLVRHRPGGKLIWGGRTTSNDPLWRYVNKRRVFLYIERSIRDAVQWSVFLPNTDITRSDLRSSIAGFLYGQWQRGVLDGAKQGDAFTVQCDTGNNPMDSRREGYLFVDVGIQPPYPAEFVVIRFRSIA